MAEYKQLRGNCTLHSASRNRDTLIGGKFYRRPLFVQPSTVTYFSWQILTQSSGKQRRFQCSVIPSSRMSCHRSWKPFNLLELKINWNYIKGSVRTPQYTHTVWTVENSQLMLYREIISILRTMQIKGTLCGHCNFWVLNVVMRQVSTVP
jgi:hypothetical protein